MSNINVTAGKPKFSGWKVVIGCFCLMFFASSVIASTAALFMEPVCREFGFETVQYSFMNLIGALTGAVAAVMLAPKMQKGNIKKILVACAIFAGAPYMLIGFCTNLWPFVLVFCLFNFSFGLFFSLI